ncbi:MAG: thioester domain-containing protein [Sciscionella sp.]
MSARSRAGRLAAVALGASIGVLGLALPASAAPHNGEPAINPADVSVPQASGDATTGRYDGVAKRGYAVNVKAGDATDYSGVIAELMKLRTSEKQTLEMYCVELTVNLNPDETLVQQPWDKYPGKGDFDKNKSKINWVLHNSYPSLKTSEVGKAAGIKGLTPAEAISATQAAIWHFSDGATLNTKDPLTRSSAAKHEHNVTALYEYLIGDANTGISTPPGLGLSVTPGNLEGHAGTNIGPFTVATTADSVALTSQLPDGVTLLDSNGKPLDPAAITNGSKIYIHVPSDAKAGKAAFTLTAQASTPVGWLFIGEHYKKHPTQSLIVANSTKTKRSASASAKWSAAVVTTTTSNAPTTTSAVVVPTTPAAPSTTPAVSNTAKKSGLAYTGVSIALPIGIAVLLLLGGGTLLLVQRKRKQRA